MVREEESAMRKLLVKCCLVVMLCLVPSFSSNGACPYNDCHWGCVYFIAYAVFNDPACTAYPRCCVDYWMCSDGHYCQDKRCCSMA